MHKKTTVRTFSVKYGCRLEPLCVLFLKVFLNIYFAKEFIPSETNSPISVLVLMPASHQPHESFKIIIVIKQLRTLNHLSN